MPGITSVGSLFFMIAKKNNWPIDNKNFLEPALVGLFAPDILRELVSETKNDLTSGIATGRRKTHFAGGSIKFPKFEDFQKYVSNPALFESKLIDGNDRFVIVDPPISINEFLKQNGWLYKSDPKSIAFMIGLETALQIDKNWDYTVQQKRMHFHKRNANRRGEDGLIRISSARSILNKLYPRLDKKLIDESNLDEKNINEVKNIIEKYYPKELLEKAFYKWWRIPDEKELKCGKEWQEQILLDAFPDSVLDYYKDDCIGYISNIDRIKEGIINFNKSLSMENVANFGLDAEVQNQQINVHKEFAEIINERLPDSEVSK